MKNYCVCILLNKELTKTLLIKKAQGKWFGGMYNGLGGKLEPGETPKDACIREIWEESNGKIALKNPFHLATLTFPREVVINLHAFYEIVDEVELDKNVEGETEWHPVSFLADFDNDRIVGDGNLAYFYRLACKHINGTL